MPFIVSSRRLGVSAEPKIDSPSTSLRTRPPIMVFIFLLCHRLAAFTHLPITICLEQLQAYAKHIPVTLIV